MGSGRLPCIDIPYIPYQETNIKRLGKLDRDSGQYTCLVHRYTRPSVGGILRLGTGPESDLCGSVCLSSCNGLTWPILVNIFAKSKWLIFSRNGEKSFGPKIPLSPQIGLELQQQQVEGTMHSTWKEFGQTKGEQTCSAEFKAEPS